MQRGVFCLNYLMMMECLCLLYLELLYVVSLELWELDFSSTDPLITEVPHPSRTAPRHSCLLNLHFQILQKKRQLNIHQAKTVNLQLNLRKARQGHINLKKLQKTTIIIIKAKCTITKEQYDKKA